MQSQLTHSVTAGIELPKGKGLEERGVCEGPLHLLFYRPKLLLGRSSAGYTKETQAET